MRGGLVYVIQYSSKFYQSRLYFSRVLIYHFIENTDEFNFDFIVSTVRLTLEWSSGKITSVRGTGNTSVLPIVSGSEH